MGYRTYYNLNINNPEVSDEQALLMIADLRTEDSDAWYALDADGHSSLNATWYNCDEDLKALSLKYPGIIFELSGTGDESGDLWSTYYKDGKMQHCPVELTYPPYDETKLQ